MVVGGDFDGGCGGEDEGDVDGKMVMKRRW